MVKEKVLALAEKIGGGIIPLTEEDPEYRILAYVTSDEEAEVALNLEIRDPKTVEEIATKCGKPADYVEKILFKMAVDGSVRLEAGKDGKDLYYLEFFVPGVMEYMCLNKENVTKYPELAVCFEEYTRKVGALMTGIIPVGGGIMRVIPIESAVKGDSRRASYEEISDILNKHDYFALADCACRTSMRAAGQGCGHTVEDICVYVGGAAEFYVRTGKARKVTKEEAIATIKRAEEEGLMHSIPNTAGPGNALAICNCCGCSCFGLRNANLYRNPDWSRSNYVSQVDKEKCVACGECVENCPSNALTLGQSICAKETVAIPGEEIEKPTDSEWGPDKWNPDYRDRLYVAETGTSPCKAECPAHIAVQGYIKLASQGKYTEALQLIKKENPFPAICGRICPRKCESACTRGKLDEALAVDDIKKFIADQDLNAGNRYIPEKLDLNRTEKIAVIGAGPAGLSCAYFLAVMGYPVTVFEKQKVLGGMLTMGVPSYRLEKDVINAEIDVLKALGVEFKTGVEVGTDTSIPTLRRLGYKAFYLAIGAQAGRGLGLEGEDAAGVMTGVDFLRKVNLGEEVKLDGSTVVIGGGNVAIDVAMSAERVGASQVDMFCLESRDEMPARDDEIEEATSEGIVINNSWGPKRLIIENGKVTGVEFKKCISVFDENRRFSPKFDENETKIVKANNVILAVGQAFDWGTLLTTAKFELNPNKTIKVDPVSYQTGEPDVFAGGDVVTGPKFAVDAIALGKIGATSIHRYVHGDSLTIGRKREFSALDRENLDFAGYDNLPRQRTDKVDPSKSRQTFKDLRGTLTEEQIKKETERCLSCGATVVDQYQCVGCGICTTKCKFDAISLTRKYDAPGFELTELMGVAMKNYENRQEVIKIKKEKKRALKKAQKEAAAQKNS